MIATLVATLLLAPIQIDAGWQLVHTDILHGISGMALVENSDDQDTFLIVHDNKKSGEGRVALVKVSRGAAPEYKPLEWDGDMPVDLEGLSTVPGEPKRYVALASAGTVYVVTLNSAHSQVSVKKSFKLPNIPVGANFEGIAVQTVGEQMAMVWGNRGDSPTPAEIYVARIGSDLEAPTSCASVTVSVPWPTDKGTRGISDMKIDPNGNVYISSASDAGDDGPFASCLYIGATLEPGLAGIRSASSARLFWTATHKIEAFEFVPGKSGGMIFGTDDENKGGAVWNNFGSG